MAKQLFVSRLALAASFFALGVIALGAFTRLIDAGLGCPDWPGCYGHLLVTSVGSPLVAYKAWAEMVHRYFVGGLSLFILAIIITIFSQKILRHRANIFAAATLLLLLAYQIMLGQWTVTLKLLPVIVSQHLLGGFLILVTLWLIYLINNPASKTLPARQHPLLLFFGLIGLLLLLLQITLGAWTSTNYAAFSCTEFPFCHSDSAMVWNYQAAFNLFSPVGMNYEGGVLPETARQTIQMTHRLGALILTFYLFLYCSCAMPRLKKSFALAKSLYVVLGLLCVQLCLGMANVILKLPLAIAISHNLVAALLLLAMTTYIFKLLISQSRGRA